MSKKKKKGRRWKQKRRRRRNKHHLIPKSRGGADIPSNIILIDIDKHRCWHTLFGNLTLGEVIRLLERLKRIKEVKNAKEEVR